MTPDIKKAKEALKQAIRHLIDSPNMFKSPKYTGNYQGWKTKHEHSKYLQICKDRVKQAKKKLEDLERKFYRRKNKG